MLPKTQLQKAESSKTLKLMADDPQIKNAIDHYKKLIVCEQFIVTGSYGWALLGLASTITDLDIILVNPTEESLNLLDRIKEPKPQLLYPEGKTQFAVLYEAIHIDFFVKNTKIDTIDLANGLSIASIKGTIKAKKAYARLKDWMQLKNIADMFYSDSDFLDFLKKEQNKIK